MYKKAERLAKAIHLIAPAFAESVALRDRIDSIAVGLVDAAILPPSAARVALSRELLTLSSVLAIARTSGLLSPMNADLMSREAHYLLQEIASYEEPRLALDDTQTLSEMSKSIRVDSTSQNTVSKQTAERKSFAIHKRHIKDTHMPAWRVKDRHEAILSVIKSKGTASIKDISHMVRGVSEKTVQRELISLIEQGVVQKQGERRWSVYSLA